MHIKKHTIIRLTKKKHINHRLHESIKLNCLFFHTQSNTMSSTIVMSLNKNAPFMPTLTDAASRPSASVARTPTPSPNLLLRRRLQRYGANGPPTLKKRKRHNNDASSSQSTFLPINTNLPLLDFTTSHDDDDDDVNERRRQADVFPPLPSIALKKRSSTKNNFFLSSPQDFYLQQEVQVQVQSRVQQQQAEVEETQDLQEPAPRRRRTNTSSSAHVASVFPPTTSSNTTVDNVLSMPRSISLQFSLSLMNLASANGSNSSCSQLLLPTRKKSLHIQKALSTMTLDLYGGNHSSSENEMMISGQRARSPVTTTLDYLAKSMRFPDVAIGLSI
jgi:hypothetical protein